MFIEVSGGINLGPMLSILVNEDARAACHQIGGIPWRNVGILHNSLLCRIGRKIIRPKLYPVALPEKLGGVLAFYSSVGRHTRDESAMDVILRHKLAVDVEKIRPQPSHYQGPRSIGVHRSLELVHIPSETPPWLGRPTPGMERPCYTACLGPFQKP